MNTVVEKLPKCLATLRVEVPADEVAKERSTIVATLTRKARIPGFRPGKTPKAVIEKRFAKDISAELTEKLVDAAFKQALEQEQLKVLDLGTIGDATFGEDGGFSFSTTLTLAPEFTLPDYKGIPVTAPPAALPEGVLDAQLQHVRERFAEYPDITDRTAELGDFAVIDYTSTVDGQPTEEFLGKPAGFLAGREGFWVRLGDEHFLPGFAAQVVGMAAGEARDIPIPLPEDFAVAGLAGKTLVLATTLKELKQAVPAELNDELANRIVPGKTMEELTGLIEQNLIQEHERRISDHKVNQIIAYLNSSVDFELPESLILDETQTQADDLVERGLEAGMSEEEIQTRQDEIFNAASHQAVNNIRTNFILREIAAVENLAISDQELATHLVEVAVSRKLDPKKFIGELRKSKRIESVRRSMLVGKAIDFLLEHATVTEESSQPLAE